MDTKYKIIVSNTVDEKMDEIYAYISRNAGQKIMQKIEASIRHLAEFPCMYPISKIPGYRKFNVNNFIIFYQVDDKNKLVRIADIYHGAQNYGNGI